MSNEFSLSELYEVYLKTTYPIEINGRLFEEDETICVFDKVQISNFNEVKKYVTAHGGFGDTDRVFWETTKEVDINFSQGIFNQLQFALLCNARIIMKEKNEALLISKREEVESNEEGIVKFSYLPNKKFFIYDKKTSEKITDYEILGNGEVNIKVPFKVVILDYTYNYFNDVEKVLVGNRLIEGFLKLEGKTRVKDDITGKTRTGIIQIPKLKLMSGLSMRLGKNANPVVANFSVKALPSGNRGNTNVMNILFLNDDIDSDM